MIAECVVIGVGLASSVCGYFLRPRAKAEPEAVEEKRCTGYRFGHGVVNKMRNDCSAPRLAVCLDGRCSYHCSQMCKCATPEGLR